MSAPPDPRLPADEATVDRLRSIEGPGPRQMDELRDGLAARASSIGALDVGYRTIDSPFGALLLAMTPAGLVRVAFEREDFDQVLVDLAAAVSPRILRSTPSTEQAARELGEYFGGGRRDFDVAIDLRLVTGFRRDVVSHLTQIPYGRTASYAEVALAAGSPAAVRAVGSACSHNPVPLVVPCHRVVRSDGSTGQYLGGAEVKVALLQMEADG